MSYVYEGEAFYGSGRNEQRRIRALHGDAQIRSVFDKSAASGNGLELISALNSAFMEELSEFWGCWVDFSAARSTQ